MRTPSYPGAGTDPLSSDGPGILIEAVEPVPLDLWLEEHGDQVRSDLDRSGAVLLRGFAVPDPESFGRAARRLSPVLLDYLERTAPRNEVAEKVFTSTEMSADHPIGMHHEMSYSHNWPGRLYFYCDIPPATGGATPLADDRVVYASIPEEVRERFVRHGVRYVRNYGPFLDLPWQEVFQTTDKAVVEGYCSSSGMEVLWTQDDGLRTIARRQAVARHHNTGATVWFNHAHLFHATSLPEEVAEVLISEVGLDGLPRNTTYGDGIPIEDEVVLHIHALYDAHSISFPWRAKDVLVIDNLLVTHGREPYTGQRRVLVAMSDLMGATKSISSGAR